MVKAPLRRHPADDLEQLLEQRGVRTGRVGSMGIRPAEAGRSVIRFIRQPSRARWERTPDRRARSAARSRPRWCSPWIEGSVLPSRSAISPGVRPTRWRSTSTWRWSSGSVASASVSACWRSGRRRRRRCSWRTSSHGIARRWRMWSIATLRATRMIQAENGTSRASYLRQHGHQLREHVLSDVLGLVLVADRLRHVAVDVVGVADVEEAQRLTVALLGPRDGARDQALTLRVALDARSTAELTGQDTGRRVRLGGREGPAALDEPELRCVWSASASVERAFRVGSDQAARRSASGVGCRWVSTRSWTCA